MNKKKVLTLTILGLLSLIAITVGVTYAFFSYTKEGTTENSITTGTITFLYTEVSGVGRGISIDDAYPISDSVGKAQTGEGKVFDFKVTSTTQMNASIPYEVTARKKSDSTLDESAVKLYLTKVDATEEEVLLDNYSNLTQTDKIASSKYTEKTIYTGKVPANSTNYEQNFRLRMWIDEEVDFSQNEDESYPYNDKTFTVTVNVYANAKVVTDEEIELESTAEISSLSVEGTELTKVENEDYDYETLLEEGTTSTTIDIETANPNAKVEVERLDSLAYSNNIKRLGVKKTLELTPGDNYFKITVISENGEVKNEYKLNIFVGNQMDSSSALAIGQAVTGIDGSKWHVLEASSSGTETVVLLSDYNLNDDGTYNLELQVVPRPFDPDTWHTDVYYNVSEINNIGYFLKNTYEPLVVSSLPGTTNVTIPTMYQIFTADGKNFNQEAVTLDSYWLTTTNYWTNTKSTADGRHIWRINKNQLLTTYSDWISAGARPVITTPKTNLLAQ